MKRKSVAVLGLGIFGATLAQELSHFDCDVIAVDKVPDHVAEVADIVETAVIGDITDFDFLESIGLGECDIVIIATGANLESSVLAVMHAKKLKVDTIIAKAKNTTYEAVLYEIGVHMVISPERSAAKQLSSKILRNRIDEILKLDEDASIIEFDVPNDWIGKTVVELDLRRKYHLNLIGTRPEKGSKLNTAISANSAFEANTVVVAIANDHSFEKYDYLGYLN